MPRPVTRTCQHCADLFQTTSARARFCSDRCRSKAHYAARVGRDVTPPATVRLVPALDQADRPGGVAEAVRQTLADHDAMGSTLGPLALHLARIMDASEGMSASGVAAVSRELRATMTAVLGDAVPVGSSPIDEIKRARVLRIADKGDA